MRIASLALIAFLSSSVAFAQAKSWEVDGAHAAIVFKINHLGFSNVYGMINGLEGKIMFDDAHPEKSSFDLKASADKLTTGVQKRDDHLHGPDFFNAKQFPSIELKSRSIKKSGEKFDIVADVTMLGVTKPISFIFMRNKVGKDMQGNTRMGGDTAFKIKRTDYGMKFMSKPGEVGDEVDLMISLEAVQK